MGKSVWLWRLGLMSKGMYHVFVLSKERSLKRDRIDVDRDRAISKAKHLLKTRDCKVSVRVADSLLSTDQAYRHGLEIFSG